MLHHVVTVVLLLAVLASLPFHRWSRGWGPLPGGLLLIVLMIWLVAVYYLSFSLIGN